MAPYLRYGEGYGESVRYGGRLQYGENVRYGENSVNAKTRHSAKHRKRTRWHKKHRVLTVPSSMNNYTDIHYFYDLEDPLNATNASASLLTNHFYRKKLMLGDMSARRAAGAQPLTTVIVIASIFLFITMSVTAATVVFCKKKNTVFVLNKSEQEDGDYELELDDLENTDVDFLELQEEYELRREQQPGTSRRFREEQASSSRRFREEQASSSRRFREEKQACRYEQDGYRRMVVTATVENETPVKKHGIYKSSSTSDSDLSVNESAQPIVDSEHTRARDYQRQIDCSGDPGNVKELLRCLPLGSQTIQYINGKRCLVCELPDKQGRGKEKGGVYSLGAGIDIQPDSSSIQGESSPAARPRDAASFHESEEELICDGLDDPYLGLGMTHSQSMGVIMNPNHEHNLRLSLSTTDFHSNRS